MIVVFVGASGSGKSTIEEWLSYCQGYQKIVSYTTREPREGEVDGKDYRFITNEEFNTMIDSGLFAEYEEYSQNRLYGTLKSDYTSEDKVVVLTPNGLRQLKTNLGISKDILSFYIDTNLGNRIIRYIKRCGIENFTLKDKDEIAARSERDYVMFLGVKNEVDCVINGNRSVPYIHLDVMKEIDKRNIENKNRLWS